MSCKTIRSLRLPLTSHCTRARDRRLSEYVLRDSFNLCFRDRGTNDNNNPIRENCLPPMVKSRFVVNVCVCVLRTGVTWLWPEDRSPTPAGKSTTASGKKARHSHTSHSSDLNKLHLNYRGGANFHLHLLYCTSPPHNVPPKHHCVKHQPSEKRRGETPTDWDNAFGVT